MGDRQIVNSSPSASATSGFGVELPATISFFNNLVRAGCNTVSGMGDSTAYVGSFLNRTSLR